MLLIIGAMKEELAEILANSAYRNVKDELGTEYHDLNNRFLITISKIGLTNASLSLSHWLTKYPNINKILVLGTAGSISPDFQQGDACYIQKTAYGNADITAFGYKYGQIPQMPAEYNLLAPKLPIKKANLISLDVFIDQKRQQKFLAEKLGSNWALVDMEGSAFCQTAFRFNKPISMIKIVSDSLYKNKNAAMAFDHFLPQAAEQLNQLLTQYLAQLSNS